MSKLIISCAVTGSARVPSIPGALPLAPKQVAKVCRNVEERGRGTATPDRARTMLGLKRCDRVES